MMFLMLYLAFVLFFSLWMTKRSDEIAKQIDDVRQKFLEVRGRFRKKI